MPEISCGWRGSAVVRPKKRRMKSRDVERKRLKVMMSGRRVVVVMTLGVVVVLVVGRKGRYLCKRLVMVVRYGER
jgi:hypothetical protein